MATSGSFDKSWSSGTWAGYPKSYQWKGNWTRTSSGITLSGMQMRMFMTSSSHSGSGSGTDTVKVTPGGSSQSVTMTFSGRYSSWASLNNVSTSLSASATSQTFTLGITGETSGSVTLNFDAAQFAPATPTCSVAALLSSSNMVTWGTSNLGSPAGSVSLYAGVTSSPDSLIETKNTTGSSFTSHNNLTSNTTYYYQAVATNSVGTASSPVVSAITKPAELTSLSVRSLSSDEVTLTAVFAPSGDALTTGVEASINDSGTWDDLGLSDVQGTTQTITLGPFQAETTYTVSLRVYTTAGTSLASSVTFTTPPPVRFYGSANGVAEAISPLYGSVNNQRKEIVKMYGSVNGVAKLMYKG